MYKRSLATISVVLFVCTVALAQDRAGQSQQPNIVDVMSRLDQNGLAQARVGIRTSAQPAREDLSGVIQQDAYPALSLFYSEGFKFVQIENFEWDPPGEALRLARDQKRYLTRQGLPGNKVTVVDGGYATRTIELWIVRPGARFEHGPFVFPNRLRVTGRRSLEIDARPFTIEGCCKVCMRRSKNAKFK